MRPILSSLALAVAIWFAIGDARPLAAAPVGAVTTPGVATLRKCRDFIVMVDCKEFNRIAIPVLVRVGDGFEVVFSSNIKIFTFVVRSIDLADGACRLADVTRPEEDAAADLLLVGSCAAAP